MELDEFFSKMSKVKHEKKEGKSIVSGQKSVNSELRIGAVGEGVHIHVENDTTPYPAEFDLNLAEVAQLNSLLSNVLELNLVDYD